MKKLIHHDVYIGAAVIILSVLGLVKTLSMPDKPAIFPQLMLAILILLMIPVIHTGIKRTKALNDGSNKKVKLITFAETKMPLLSFVIVAVYAGLIDFLGFFVSTAIFVTAFMIFYRIKNWRKIALTIVGLSIFIYLLFVKQLNVPIPTGILF